MRTRSENPHNLPPRLYERRNQRTIAWWSRAPSGNTVVLRSVPATATEEQIKAARQEAIYSFSRADTWGEFVKAPAHVDWAASFGVSVAPPPKMINGMPAWAARLFRRSKHRAKERGILWALTRPDLAELARRCGGRCEVSGVRLVFTESGAKGPYGPSLDRIDSANAYTLANTRIVCLGVNFALNSWGLEVFLPIARGLVEHHPAQDQIPNFGKHIPKLVDAVAASEEIWRSGRDSNPRPPA